MSRDAFRAAVPPIERNGFIPAGEPRARPPLPAPHPGQQERRLSAGITIAVALILLSIIVHAVVPSGDRRPAPTATAAVPVANVPSATAAIPTATIAPTNTPVPTATVAPAATPDPTAQWLAAISDLEAAKQSKAAAEKAEAGAQQPGITRAQAADFIRRAVNDYLAYLASEPFQPANRVAQEAYVTLYRQHIDEPARVYGVRIPAAIDGEDDAWVHGQYLLAMYLWEKALADGQITQTDQQQVRRYYAIVYAIGVHWTQDRSNTDLMNEGVRYLYTALELSRKYALGGEADGRLRELFGEKTMWPPEQTVPSPLVGAKGA